MTTAPKILMTSDEVRVAILLLGRENAVVQKTLQNLEGALRSGRVPADPRELRAAVLNCLLREDLSVKRWALNALVYLGLDKNFSIFDDLIEHCAQDPDLLASAIRLLFNEMREASAFQFMARADFPINGLALIAGSEFSTRLRKQLMAEKIPLEKASPEELRAAIVLTGRGRAPENLFLRDHPNTTAVAELNLHDDATVVKYALWGMVEMGMDYSQLKIPLDQVDSAEEQVRKWMYRLLTSSEAGLRQNIDVISHLRKDESDKVREEGAIGLRHVFVEEALGPILQWHCSETCETVVHALVEHMANSMHCDLRYRDTIFDVYGDAAHRSMVRQRIEAVTQGSEFYVQLRAVEARQEFGGFLEPLSPEALMGQKKNEFYISGGSFGNFVGEGQISAGSQQMTFGLTTEQIRELIEGTTKVLELVDNDDLKGSGKEVVEEFKEAPTRFSFKRLVSFLKLANEGSTAGSELAQKTGELLEYADPLLAQLGIT